MDGFCKFEINRVKQKKGMDMNEKEDKIQWVLDLYTRLLKGDIIYKKEEAVKFGVTEKSIQRDINNVRVFLSNRTVKQGIANDVVYDQKHHGYQLKKAEQGRLSNKEVLAVTKILLESRAFTKPEMMNILNNVVECCVLPENRNLVNDMLGSERLHYIELQHRKKFMDKMWEIAVAIKEQRCIKIVYEKTGTDQAVTRKVDPLAIMFSEFYFYLAAHLEDIDREKEFQITNDTNPTIYRIDRIRELAVLEEHYKVSEKDRFQAGEDRKQIQFMYGGKQQMVEFWYKGWSVEAVLDKLPTAEVLETDKEKKRYRIRAKTFGKGIDMWLRSQGDFVEVIRKFEI